MNSSNAKNNPAQMNTPTPKSFFEIMGTSSLAQALTSGRPALSPEEFARQVAEIDAQSRAQLARERAAARQRAYTRMLGEAAIPEDFVGADLYAQPMPDQADAYRAAQEAFLAYSARGGATTPQARAGMLIFGPVGAGKSHLACALANAMIAAGRTALYTTLFEGVMRLKGTWRAGAETSEEELFRRLGAVDLLVLDEIGIQRGTETEALFISTVADRRARARLPTVCVSNYGPEEILAIWGERNFDRLLGWGGMMVRVPRSGSSLRQRAAAGPVGAGGAK